MSSTPTDWIVVGYAPVNSSARIHEILLLERIHDFQFHMLTEGSPHI